MTSKLVPCSIHEHLLPSNYFSPYQISISNNNSMATVTLTMKPLLSTATTSMTPIWQMASAPGNIYHTSADRHGTIPSGSICVMDPIVPHLNICSRTKSALYPPKLASRLPELLSKLMKSGLTDICKQLRD